MIVRPPEELSRAAAHSVNLATMAKPGPKPRPLRAVLREGNPGKHPLRESVTLPPSPLVEPVWAELLPGGGADESHARGTVAALWRKLAPSLARSVGLVGEQQECLVDYCITWARIEQGERALSRTGMLVAGRGGQVRNPWTTILNQYRAHLRSLIGELGLSPSAATRLHRPDAGGDDDDPFD
jgi:P27 family predicted phage terminase small subunit